MVEILFILVPSPWDVFLAHGGQRPLFMHLGHVFYLCLSNFKSTRSNCKPIHNAFCITVRESNHKYYLYLCWVGPPFVCLHSPRLQGLTLLGSRGATSIWHSCLHGIFPSVVFLWHELANEVIQNVCLVTGMLVTMRWSLLIWLCVLW
jgi:hypothetical protein